MEQISPELVLVDPELAQAERTRLVECARLDALERARPEPLVDIATLRRAVEAAVDSGDETMPPPGPRNAIQWSREHLLPGVLLLSLLANGVLLAMAVGGNGGGRISQAAPAALRGVTSAAPGSVVTSTAALSEISTGGTLGAKAIVERKVVSRLLRASPGKLPPQLTDRSTGLLKSGIQVICHPKAAGSFLCAVRLPGQARGKTLFLRYRPGPNGRDVFTWSLSR